MFRRKHEVTAPDGTVWTVQRRWGGVNATRLGAYHSSGGLGRRESLRELDRVMRAIESGELDAEVRAAKQARGS